MPMNHKSWSLCGRYFKGKYKLKLCSVFSLTDLLIVSDPLTLAAHLDSLFWPEVVLYLGPDTPGGMEVERLLDPLLT